MNGENWLRSSTDNCMNSRWVVNINEEQHRHLHGLLESGGCRMMVKVVGSVLSVFECVG